MKSTASRALTLGLAAAVIAFAGGCKSTPSVSYADPAASDPMSTQFEMADLHQVAEKMVDSMLAFEPVAKMTAERRPVVVVGKVVNRTMQHIDTQAVTDTIRTRLIRSGKFQFVDRSTNDQVVEELRNQVQAGIVNPASAQPLGQQVGAEYILTAGVTQFMQEQGRVKDVHYKITMNLQNLRTGIIEWADEKEIRKVQTRSRFGL